MSLPTTPIAVISIPIISSAKDITMANTGSPRPRPIGCAIRVIEAFHGFASVTNCFLHPITIESKRILRALVTILFCLQIKSLARVTTIKLAPINVKEALSVDNKIGDYLHKSEALSAIAQALASTEVDKGEKLF
jgi:hypothetical protein